MYPLREGELFIASCRTPVGAIRLDWSGRSDARRPGDVLGPYLQEVLLDAQRNPATIEMHFEALEYLNSSTIAVVMHFLKRARESRVPLLFTYQPQVRWQKLSFEALRVFEQLDQLVRVVPLR